jgi:DNA-binding SARP family transcriptional activator
MRKYTWANPLEEGEMKVESARFSVSQDITGAVPQMYQSVKTYSKYGEPIMVPVEQMKITFSEADINPVESLAQKVIDELSHLMTLKPEQGYLELCQTFAGALCKEAGDYAAAEKLLLEAFNTAKNNKAVPGMWRTAIHLADLYYRKNDYKQEEKYLRLWGRSAAAGRYTYFHDMNSTMAGACARCIEKNIYPEIMQHILLKYYGTDEVRVLEKPALASDPDMVVLPQQVIKLKLFGQFKMWVDGVEIGENVWKTRKICGILKYLLANSGQVVPRETLAAMFWPESDTKASSTSLRTALYELKKALAHLELAFGSWNALIVENKSGFCVCARNTLEIDVDTFTGLYKQSKTNTLSTGEIRDILIQMTQLYDGDFLADGPYNDWVAATCEHYKAMFVEASHKLADLYLNEDAYGNAESVLIRHMKIDPFDERACSMLIHIFNNTDQESRAASLCRQFAKRFQAEMGMKPDLHYAKSS